MASSRSTYALMAAPDPRGRPAAHTDARVGRIAQQERRLASRDTEGRKLAPEAAVVEQRRTQTVRHGDRIRDNNIVNHFIGGPRPHRITR